MSIVIDATYDGGRHEYYIPFPYLEKAFVKCKLNDKELTINVDYEVEGSTLTLYRDTQATDTIKIYRQTTTDRLVKFHDGSVLREADLTLLQLQLLNVIEEQGTFTIGTTEKDNNTYQIEETVTLADGVSCERGDILGYKKGGYVKATNTDYTTLADLVLALQSSNSNKKINVLVQGKYTVTDTLTDGNMVYVGEDGKYITSPPNTSGRFVKNIGIVKSDAIIFHPDTLAIKLA